MASQNVYVRSVEALEELRKRLVLFQEEAEAALREMEAAIQQALHSLYERERRWQRKAEIADKEYHRALAALDACQRVAVTGPDGKTYSPPCIAEKAWVARAGKQLRETREKWQEVVMRRRRVEQAAEELRRRVQRFVALAQRDLIKAREQLDRQARKLYEYIALSSSAGAPFTALSSPPGALQTTPPSQVVQDGLAIGLTLTAMGAGAIGLALLRWLQGSWRDAVGRQAGEALAADLVQRELGLREIPFDPPKQGFDRVFLTPDNRVVILESKVREDGRFYPGRTKKWGEQGSPEWIAAHADRMADPTSKAWTPTNERVAALIRELGVENVAVLGVAIERDTGRASVYVRRSGERTWEPLQEGVALEEILGMPAGFSVQEIPLQQIDWDELGDLSAEEYRKVSIEEMREGLRKLVDVVRPAVEAGATAEDFSRMDEEQGLDYAHGYRRIYDAFYGANNCIVVEKVGARYQVINGRHRLLLARAMGVDSLPAQVLTPPRDSKSREGSLDTQEPDTE